MRRLAPIALETKSAAPQMVSEDIEVIFPEIWGEIDYKADGDGAGEIAGYASIFGEEDRINDIVLPGAFTKSLKEKKSTRLPMLVGHVQRIPVGVWTEIVEDRKGLRVKGKIDIESPDGGQLHRVLKMGAEIGISIGYRAVVHEYQTDPKTNDTRRLLKQVDLYEISLVTIPCCDGARVTSVKAMPQEAPEDTAHRAALALAHKNLNDFETSLAADRLARIFANFNA